jgi:digeranylgeranylglycerophospholipid reductase
MPETIIIGAGPGGLMAGRYLEDALILDQKKEIGKPVRCAEGISRESLERQKIKPDKNWISAFIDAIQLVSPSGKIINIGKKNIGFVLERSLFEKFLASQCKAKIRLEKRVVNINRENGLWKIRTERNETFKSKYLIGADGPFSIVREKIFKEKVKLLPTIEYLIELEREIDTFAMKIYFDREKFPSGYAWLFPKSKRTANIGLGSDRYLNEKFKDFLERVVRKEFGNYKFLENRSGVIPWGGTEIKLFKNNAFLVGNAGGLVDPVFGGGINNAMVSGEIAAKCILSKKPELYERKIKSLPFFNPNLLLAQKILYSLSNQVLNEIAEILEKKGIFYLKTIPAFFKLLSKHHLRKNVFKILKLFLILEKNRGSFK